MDPASDHRSSSCRCSWSWLQACLAITALCCLPQCSFGDDDEQTGAEQNSCQTDSDCQSKLCEDNRCVEAKSPLKVALVVTPKRMPDGTQPQPIVSAPFLLQAGPEEFSLTRPISLPVRVLNAGQPIPAQVSFTPVKQENPLTSATTTINMIVPTAGQPDPANNVVLLGDTEYSVVVQPVNLDLPVRTIRVTPQAGEPVEIDYGLINWQTRLFMVLNAPHEPYMLRARAVGGGAYISSSAQVQDNSVVNLRFDEGALGTNYVLELAPVKQAQASKSDAVRGATDCGSDTASAPVITFSSEALRHDNTLLEVWVLDLPTVPEPIQYQAQVQLCPNQTFNDALSVALNTTSVFFDGGSSMVSARYDSTTTATWDGDAQAFSFCTRVLPGDYTIKITPPPNVNCEIFAERRALRAEADEPDQLNLRTPATLSGRIVSPDMAPIANASIDLAALKQSNVVLAPDDPTVPLFNRSRQVTTLGSGAFSFPADVGTYDFTVKPPTTSNFAWRILYSVDVGARGTAFSTVVDLKEPVVVTGQLNYVDGSSLDQSSLALADVSAFTLVDKDTPNARSLEIARGQADAQGNVTLLLPPTLQHNWIPE